jgi:cytoskeletal protein RodZ
MKEIGEKLREARESMGISIEEAAEDLKLRPSQLENIEEGKREAFNDIFYLKYFIRDYSKYLGLDYEEMVEDFNEFVFDYTSKISLEDIKKANKKNNKKEQQNNKVMSPYTISDGRGRSIPMPIVYGLIIFFICLIIYSIVLAFQSNDSGDNANNEISGTRETPHVLLG